MQAFVKARGDGLGFDLGRASFTITDEDTCKTARVSVDGKRQPLCAPLHCLLAWQMADSMMPNKPTNSWDMAC